MSGLDDRGRVELAHILEATDPAERRARIEEFKSEHDMSDSRQRMMVNRVLEHVPGEARYRRNAAVGFAVIALPVAVVAWVLWALIG